MIDVNSYLSGYGKKAKKAVTSIANSSVKQRNDALIFLAQIIEENKNEIYRVNEIDVKNAKEKGLSSLSRG